MREAVGIFDVSHLGKATVGPGRRRVRQRHAHQRPGPDPARQGAVHALLRRRDRRDRRRPDRLPHTDERVLLVPNAANTAEVARRLGEAARTASRSRPAQRLRRAGRPGHQVRRGLDARRAAPGHEYMSFVEAEPGSTATRRRRLPHRLHRRARLRADRRQRRRRPAVGRAARGRRAARHAALRPRRPRHAAHRDGLPAARPGHLARRHPQPGPARLGGRLAEGRRSGAATRCREEKEEGPERILRGLGRHRPRASRARACG